jgi:hypothetical protein
MTPAAGEYRYRIRGSHQQLEGYRYRRHRVPRPRSAYRYRPGRPCLPVVQLPYRYGGGFGIGTAGISLCGISAGSPSRNPVSTCGRLAYSAHRTRARARPTARGAMAAMRATPPCPLRLWPRACSTAVRGARHVQTTATTSPRSRLPVYYDPRYTVALPPGHRFPMERYAATAGLLTTTLARYPSLRAELAPAREATHAELCTAHSPHYVEAYTRDAAGVRDRTDVVWRARCRPTLPHAAPRPRRHRVQRGRWHAPRVC